MEEGRVVSHKPCCGSKPRPDRRHWREPKPNSSTEFDSAKLETLSEFSYSSEGEIDTDVITTVGGQYYHKRAWVPTDPLISSFTGATAWTMKKRPGTVKNPIRSDGSRKPSSFWTYWANVAIHAGAVQTVRTAGGHNTFWREGAGIDTHASPLPTVLYSSATGNLWSRRGETHVQFPGDVRNRARTKLREKLSETDWDLGVFAGEIRETASMFYDAGQRVALAINRIGRSVGKSRRVVIQTLRKADGKPLRFTKRRKGSKGPLMLAPDSWKDGMFRKWEVAIINDWLMFQYGIIPLLRDLDDIVNFAVESSFDHTTRPRVTLRAGASTDTFSKVRLYLQSGAGVVDLPVMVRSACHYAATYEIGVRPGFVERAGLGNPGSVFWNLLRFTMVVDYVVQVGRWLDALVIPSNVDFVEGSESLIQRTVNDGTERVFPTVSDSLYVVQAGASEMTSFRVDYGRFERLLLSGEGVPPPSYPQVRNALNLTRVANILALIANALKG